jgi:hypothetical protein
MSHYDDNGEEIIGHIARIKPKRKSKKKSKSILNCFSCKNDTYPVKMMVTQTFYELEILVPFKSIRLIILNYIGNKYDGVVIHKTLRNIHIYCWNCYNNIPYSNELYCCCGFKFNKLKEEKKEEKRN